MATHHSEPSAAGLPAIDINEYGGKRDGERQRLNRRLFMQLLVFDVPASHGADDVARDLKRLLHERAIGGIVYADVAQPRGVGLLTWNEDPAHFVRHVRPLFAHARLAQVVMRPSFTMFGRTYSTGHEPDLEHALIHRAVANVMDESCAWHMWYPLRRTGAFARLDPNDQSGILREHAQIGLAYGQADLAHDVRLACHGMDAEDNEFVIGLVGEGLYPLSHLVQTTRKTRHTSEYIAKMGPFFVGMVLHRGA